MEFLAVAVDKLWKCTVEPVARQVGYVIFYRSNVDKLKKEVAELQDARERVQHQIDAAERNGERIEGDVLNWLKQVDEMKMKADDLNNDERQANTACSGRSIPNLLLRHKLSRGSKEMKEEIVKIKTKGNFNSVSYRVVPNLRASSLITHGEQFGSRVLVFNDIMEALKDSNLQTIGLYGPGGVGKTTLVKEVADKSQQQKLFDVVVLAYVTQNPKTEEIQYQIADMLGLKLDEKSNEGRANRLYDRLKNKEERILVILDDLWAELKFDEIGIPSIKQHKGLKILMTSRNREVLSNKMNTQKDFVLQALTKDEAWKLFVDKAQIDVSSIHGELLLIASKIVEKCDGLPVAIVTIASSLKEKGLPAWNDALQRLQNPSTAYTTSTEVYIYNFIEVSYQNLENDLLRSIFLLCGEMTSISSIDDLFKISFGLGLFKNLSNMKEARNKFDTCIDKLKDICLLQDSNLRDRFVMHDVVQAAAIFLASRDEYLFMKIYEELQEWPENDHLRNWRTIILQQSKMDELPEGLDYPNLAFLHLDIGNSKLEVPDNFFKGMCGLKVLTLIGFALKSLPPSFSLLSNICTFTLHAESFVSKDIAIIGELKRLKVLTLSLNIRQLPEELGQLTQLQLLDLRGCEYLEMIPPNVLSSFRKLMELYLPCDIQWYIDDPNSQRCNASLAELEKLTRLTTLDIFIPDQRMLPKDLVLERLQRYHITIGGDFTDMYHNISGNRKLNLSNSIHLWENVKGLEQISGDTLVATAILLSTPKLMELCVAGYHCLPFLFSSSFAKSLGNLRLLTIEECSMMEEIIRFEDDIDPPFGKMVLFPNLEEMTITNMDKLNKIWCWQHKLAPNSFGRLRNIEIENCPELVSTFPCDIISTTHSFEQLIVIDCKSLEQIFDPRGVNARETDGDTNGLPVERESWWFQEINVKGCECLKYLFPLSVAKSFRNIRRLGIEKCSKMEEIIKVEDNIHPSFSNEVVFPKLETMVISDMDKLNTIWGMQERLAPNSFGRLEDIEIRNCPRLVSIFPCYVISMIQSLKYITVEGCGGLKHLLPATVAKQLSELQWLRIERCPMMEVLITHDNSNQSSIDEVLFPNLEEMTITNMNKLKRIWCWQQQLAPNSFGRLGEIKIINCPELISISPCCKISTSQSLKKLSIIDCKSVEQIFDLQGEKQATEVSGFPNLEEMEVEGCERLKYLFPAFVATSLGELRMLTIGKCLNMEEIIMVEDDSHHSLNKEVVFPNLETMIICDMDKLNTIWGMQQRLAPNSFGRLYSITIRNCPGLISIFPCYVISMIQSLKYITVEGCGWLKHLLPATVAKELRKLERLRIESCSMMEVLITDDYTNEFSIDEILFPNLEELIIIDMDKLNTLCHWFHLLPPTSFRKLRTLEIGNCPEFIFRSHLQSLEELRITNCKYLEQISGETLVAASILLSYPKLMELCVAGCHCLPFLFSSSSAKSLDNLRVLRLKECFVMEEIIRFEGDIDPLFGKKVVFPNLEKMSITGMPKLNTIWGLLQQLSPNSFGRLNKIEMENCEGYSKGLPLSLLKSLNNLQELQLKSCNSLREVFDLEEETDIHEDQTPRVSKSSLEILILDSLPNLKQLWNKDPRGILDFQSLSMIHVSECESVKYLFPVSVAKSLMQLEELKIESCVGLEHIVAGERGTDTSIRFVFPRVYILELEDLPKLKGFYPGRFTTEWPSLPNEWLTTNVDGGPSFSEFEDCIVWSG